MGQGSSTKASAGTASAWPFALCACHQGDEGVDEPRADDDDDQDILDDWDTRECGGASFATQCMAPDERKDSGQSVISNEPTEAPTENERCALSAPSTDRSLVSSILSEDPDQIVDNALKEAKASIDSSLLLPAEAALAHAIVALQKRGATDAVQRLKRDEVYALVLTRMQQYDLLRDTLLPLPRFKLLREDKNGYFFIYVHPGSQCFEYKMVLNIDASLGACVATANELELVRKAQPMISATPELLAPRRRHYLVTSARIGIPVFKVELLLETLRICNHDYGFMAETIRSSFPTDGIRIPPKDWRVVRPRVDTSNLWLPQGGDQRGTVLIQVSRCDAGFPVPSFVLDWIFTNLADSFMSQLRKSSARATKRGSPWCKAIREDKLGLYAELRQIETVAAQRAAISAQNLPGDEILARTPSLA